MVIKLCTWKERAKNDDDDIITILGFRVIRQGKDGHACFVLSEFYLSLYILSLLAAMRSDTVVSKQRAVLITIHHNIYWYIYHRIKTLRNVFPQ